MIPMLQILKVKRTFQFLLFGLFVEFEKKIVPWQSDSSTNCCFLCMKEFNLLNRRHHCRLCGRIICGDSGCLGFIPIKLLNEAKDLKSCSKCYKTLFRKKAEYQNRLNSNEKRMQIIFKVITANIQIFINGLIS